MKLHISFIISLISLFLGKPCLLYSESKDTCTVLSEGAPRGIQCLYCMEKSARAYTSLLTQALIDSCRESVGLAFVVDGSFGFDIETINSQISDLVFAGRDTWLHIYILNGPAQRRWKERTFKGFVSRIPPDVFRAKLQHNKKLRDAYQALVSRVLPAVQLAHGLGAHVSISPMLEDNLDNRSFSTILKLTQEMFPSEYNITYVRNACSDCYPGNQWLVPGGVAKEDHKVAANFRQKNGVISNDGWGYVYFSESEKVALKNPVTHSDRQETALSLDQLRPLMERANQQNNLFLLWIAKFQQTLPGSKSRKVSERKFPRPTARELELISRFFAS